MTLTEWIEQHPGEDAWVLARKVIADDPDACVQAVAGRIEHIRRSFLRAAEDASVAPFLKAIGGNPITLTTTGKDGEPKRLVLPSEPFRLGDGTRVSWLFATIEQHKQRIDMLKKQVRGINHTINLHRLAIKRLEETGARCLDEVSGAA